MSFCYANRRQHLQLYCIHKTRAKKHLKMFECSVCRAVPCCVVSHTILSHIPFFHSLTFEVRFELCFCICFCSCFIQSAYFAIFAFLFQLFRWAPCTTAQYFVWLVYDCFYVDITIYTYILCVCVCWCVLWLCTTIFMTTIKNWPPLQCWDIGLAQEHAPKSLLST